jgi:acyl-coenzyme A thioesterase PaaI-like protein
MSAYDPLAHGWRAMPSAALPASLGAPWARKMEGQRLYGLLTGPEHVNPNGVIHGGVLMAFADHGLSLLAWEAAERTPCTTIQLNTHFLDAIKPGEFIELRGEVVRRTRGMVFVRGRIVAHHADPHHEDKARDVGAVDGIWRVLRSR